MKVFFAISPRAIKEQHDDFKRIHHWFGKQNHTQLNSITADTNPDTFYDCDPDEVDDMYAELVAKLKKADAVIVETTIHSLTMGFYIKMALDLNKPTIILHKPGAEPFFFTGIKNAKLLIEEYDEHSIEQVLSSAIEFAELEKEMRFNMFLNSSLSSYLHWAAKKAGMQRSQYMRQLLLKDKEEKLEEYEADL